MKFGVVVFPGSNCDHDAFYAVSHVLQKPVEFIWHQSEDLAQCDAVIFPGGFAFGDYLRTGAIARFSPVMKSVGKFAKNGGMVLGICNGFQILTEAGLLPGAMMRNVGLRYICRHVHIRVEETDTAFTGAAKPGQILKVPIAHNDGNYTCDAETLAELENNRQIIFRYTTADGKDDDAGNPNGSMANIAGICNRERNVVGLMPHPERAVEAALDSDDGLVVFQSMVEALTTVAKATA
ncbi:MAG TPA: phosphoribosylformylglycinamidine synthase subunit PurQ [Candidatus Acidoferrum sp.]|jgi:phosphoribosylformylglycinamidine synthase